MGELQKIIDETEIIQRAIELNRPRYLVESLPGFFNRRWQLIEFLKQTETRQQLHFLQIELLSLNDLIGRILVYLNTFQPHSLMHIANELYESMIVESRAIVLELAIPILDRLDREHEHNPKAQLLGVVGMIASGKGTVGEILYYTYNSLHFPISDRLREVAVSQARKPPFSRDDLREVNKLKEIYGNPVFVNWTINLAKRISTRFEHPLISMDGFRSVEEAMHFKQQGGILIAVTASQHTRFERVKRRARQADDFNWEKFRASDELEGAWILPILEIADYRIENEGDREEFEKQLIALIESLNIPNLRKVSDRQPN